MDRKAREGKEERWGIFTCGTMRSRWLEIIDNRGRKIAKVTMTDEKDVPMLIDAIEKARRYIK